jgi:hypothetical protein
MSDHASPASACIASCLFWLLITSPAAALLWWVLS